LKLVVLKIKIPRRGEGPDFKTNFLIARFTQIIRTCQSKSGLNQTGSGISYPIVKEQNPLSSRKL